MEYTHTNFAYEGATLKLFPLAALDSNGVVDRDETLWLVREALATFAEKSIQIPAPERDSVRNQIEGAAISLGLTAGEENRP